MLYDTDMMPLQDKITMASGQGGAQRQSFDFSESKSGLHKWSGWHNEKLGISTGQFGSRMQSFGVSSYEGNYRGNDGGHYYGNFQYRLDNQGNRVLVSGNGTNLQTYSVAGSVQTPRGESFKTVDTKVYSQGGTKLQETSLSGHRVTHDNSRSFSGGYVYSNYMSSLADEKGYGGFAESLGKVQGVFQDVQRFIGLGHTVRAISRGNPASGKIPTQATPSPNTGANQ